MARTNIITDQNDVIVDMATEKENLSRGYTFPGYIDYLDVEADDLQLGDSYADGIHIKNPEIRAAQKLAAEIEAKISAQIRKTAINTLKAGGELPADFESVKP